jgi:N6-adenosine-specific RNA methylase IME4
LQQAGLGARVRRNAVLVFRTRNLLSVSRTNVFENCALFLWVTDPMLPNAFELINKWGFEYKTVGFYWVKLNAAAKHDNSLEFDLVLFRDDSLDYKFATFGTR